MGKWLVARIYTPWGAIAQRELDLLSVEHFLPKERVRKIVRGRIIGKNEPLFPGYLFIKSLQWRFLHRVRGICYVLRHAESDEPVRSPALDKYIKDLRAVMEDDVLIKEKSTKFYRGERVRSIQGLLYGYCGVYLKDLANHRGRVSLDGITVDMNLDDLEAA